MRNPRFLLLGVVLLAASLAVNAKTVPHPQRHGRVLFVTFHSPALEGNLLGDPAVQTMGVYLPPSYQTAPGRRYPVLYLLHGFGGSGAGWFQKPEPGAPPSSPLLQKVLDEVMTSGAVQEMIVVTPNGRNKRVGSFYLNSAVTGNWEDAIVRDVVGYVDAHYRTIADRDARGLAGNSMGGFGALVLGAHHPDIFGAVYAISPCCTAMVEDMTDKNPAWQTLLRIEAEHRTPNETESKDFYVGAIWALATALTPDPNRPPLLVDFPYKEEGGKIVHEPAVYATWEQKLPLAVLPQNAAGLQTLRGLVIEYGYQDEFAHIPEGARMVSEQLAARNVPHTVTAITGTHMDHLFESLEMRVLPYFSRTLKH
jgi:enterochelin esterase-like enzyme